MKSEQERPAPAHPLRRRGGLDRGVLGAPRGAGAAPEGVGGIRVADDRERAGRRARSRAARRRGASAHRTCAGALRRR